MRTPRIVIAAFVVSVVVAASGCATTPGAVGGSLSPAPPEGEVVAQGTVLDDGTGTRLCLGGVAESAPPQCSGIPLAGWDWDGTTDETEMSGVTWGAYAVQGTFDGETMTSTRPPVSLALYDPLPVADPTDGTPGTADEATLRDVEQRVRDTLGDTVLVTGAYDGRLWVTVVWDDGTLQAAADDEFGADVVVVQSAIREVG
ncbi:hypothetical protein [Microbacterium oleivorans]|uniref:Uncharacterized protein n=1 Tax=Microbacterium oleivorans TaxID=273677 RepID=A0A7D5IMU7_9MICO|nr:hypothetical protein [Microbacterium oleivorans]QLD10479.1 hypothetical protein HW566_00975 [Microbacterium oleivorans]